VIRGIPGLKAGATLSETQRKVAESLRASGIESPEADARLLVGHAMRLDRTRLLLESDRLLVSREVDAISALAARRLKYEPIARIIGVKEFWSLPLIISDAVLDPRPDTETVIEAALDFVVRGGLRMEPLRLLDIGTGSGALLLALLTELPNARGTATDISAAALTVARGNAERLGLASRCTFIECDIATGVPGPFDLIVSNPPYIAHDDIARLAPEVRDYDPGLALDGGPDGLDSYHAIARDARRLLADGGRLIVELGAGQEPSVRALLTQAGMTPGTARNDLAGMARALGASFAPENRAKPAP
jgi:release factor glutamine methyltransferase